MSVALLPLGVLGGAVIVVVFLTLVPAHRSRWIALVSALALVVVFAQNSTPVLVRTLSFAAAIVMLALGEVRSSTVARGRHDVVVATVVWWGLVGMGAVIASSYSLPRYALEAVLIGLMVWSLSRATRTDVRMLVRAFVVLAVVQSLLAGWEVGTGAEPLWGFRGGIERENPLVDSLVRAQGTFGHPIVLGYYLGAAFVMAWTSSRALGARSRLAALVVIGSGLVLSGTRSAIAASLLAIVVHVLLRRRLVPWIAGTAIITVAALITAILDPGISEIVLHAIDSGSWIHRSASLEAVPDLLARNGWELWWGSGYGSEITLFDDGHIALTYGLPVVDSFLVYVLGTMGIVGLVATIALVTVAFVRGSRMVRALVAYVAVMFFSFDTTVWLSSGVTMFMLLGLAGAAGGGASTRTSPSGASGRRKALAAANAEGV